MTFLVRVVTNALAVWLTSLLLGAHFVIVGATTATGGTAADPANRILVILGVGLLFALVNALIRPLLKVVALPLYILTLGLFSLVVNGLIVLVVDWLTRTTGWGIDVDGFWWAVLAGLIISVLNSVLTSVVRSR